MVDQLVTIKFLLPTSIDVLNFCGVHDSNLRALERFSGVKILVNMEEQSLVIKGEGKLALRTKKVMEKMLKLSSNVISHQDIGILWEGIKDDKKEGSISDGIRGLQVSNNRFVKAFTKNQEEYITKILKYDIVFGIGAAGTGKSYIAIAAALRELRLGNIKKIILTRPIVEADEHLGFLPGTLEEKIDPYIRPLYDAILDMVTLQEFEKMSQNNQIELSPLAYMRGRTLTDSFIILDEAQNATKNQMKMFLTRLGHNSKMVITGDMSQIDLHKQGSGLVDVISKIRDIEGISIHEFKPQDSVRHGLVKKIIEAYE